MVRRRGDSQVEGSKAKVAVVDASVVVKWFNQEEYTEPSLLMLDSYRAQKIDLIAPYLLIYEVANALRFNTEFGEADVKESLAYLRKLQLDLKPVNETDMEKAVSIAFGLGLTIYDSIYVALAEKEDGELYTADGKILAKLTNKKKKVHHISEYSS
jgi:predicted nucleic acid-binding protein